MTPTGFRDARLALMTWEYGRIDELFAIFFGV
jgi:hypothetical protein